MKFKSFLFTISLFFFGSIIIAQNVDVYQNPLVDSLLKLHKEINQKDSLVSGYRIQIFFESGNYSKDLAMQTAEEFIKSFPNTRYYLSFNEPYYRIRVGDFRTIIEAQGFLAKLISKYPSAFEVKDKVYFPLLLD